MTELVPPPEALVRDISRHVSDSKTFDTLGPDWETRWIVVAQGVQFTNELYEANAYKWETDPDLTVGKGKHKRAPTAKERAKVAAMNREMKIPHSLQKEFPKMLMWDEKFALYFSERQGVIFYIQVVDTKTALKEALETPNVHLIYYGHARYGRGPCFRPGANIDPGEDWGLGTSDETGIFRMGFPYLAVTMAEIKEHGYRAMPLLSDGNKPERADCDRDLRPHLKSMKERTLPELCMHPSKPRERLYDLEQMRVLFGEGTTDDDKFWSYAAWELGKYEWHVVLDAGWEHTVAEPLDLGATDIQCKLFCHFGCSSFVHNYEVLRKLKLWQRTDDDRFAYWTTKPSPGPVTRYWIRALFNYRKSNAFGNWRKSLEYAVDKTNQQLSSAGYGYRVI